MLQIVLFSQITTNQTFDHSFYHSHMCFLCVKINIFNTTIVIMKRFHGHCINHVSQITYNVMFLSLMTHDIIDSS
jgi:hypothetical protein